MAVVCALLFERYKAGKYPLAVVSMDNCSHNGEKLQNSITTMAKEWLAKGFVDQGFIDYISDEKQVSFPWSMIDKITPRPADSVCADLEKSRSRRHRSSYYFQENLYCSFRKRRRTSVPGNRGQVPNGRPALEKAGVYMTDRGHC